MDSQQLDNQNALAKEDTTDQDHTEKNEVSLDSQKDEENYPCKEQEQDTNLADAPAKLEEGKSGEEDNSNEGRQEEGNLVAAQEEKQNEQIDEEALNSSIQEEELRNEENEKMQQEEHSDEGDEAEEGSVEEGGNDDAINEEELEENEEEQSNHRSNNEDDEQSHNDDRIDKSQHGTKLEEDALKNSVFLENLIREYQNQQQQQMQLQSEQKAQQSQTGQAEKSSSNEKPLDTSNDMTTAQQESQILQLLIEQLKYQQQQQPAQQSELDSASKKEKDDLEQKNTQNQSNSENKYEADEEMRDEEEEDEIEDQREDEQVEQQQLQNEKLNINGYQQLEEETVMALINEANKLQAYLTNPQLTSEQRSLAESKHAACLAQLKKLQQLIHAESLNPALLLQSLASSQQQQQKSYNLFQSAASGSNNNHNNYSAFKNDQQMQQNQQNHPLVNFFNSYSLFINDTSNVQLDQEVVLNKLIDNAKKCKPPSNADERVNVLWEYLTDLDKQQIESFENQLKSLPEQNIYECIQTIEKLHIKLLVEYNMEVARGKNLGIIKQ